MSTNNDLPVVTGSEAAASPHSRSDQPGKKRPAGNVGDWGWRAGLCTLIAMSFAIAAGVLATHYHPNFNSDRYDGYHDGDQVLVSRVADTYSSRLCQSFKVAVLSDTTMLAAYYLTDGPAVVDPKDRQVNVFSNSGLLTGNGFGYRAFNMLPGSWIEVSACFKDYIPSVSINASIIFIQSVDRFDRWTKDPSCADCVAQRDIIDPDELCQYGKALHAHFEIDDADTYYVVITVQHRARDDEIFAADVTVTVNKTVYDVSRTKARCLQTLSCPFDLSYNSDDDIIVEFPFRERAPANPGNSFIGDCGLRVAFFLIVFLLVPASLIFFVLLTYLCRKCPGRPAAASLRQKKADSQAILASPGHYDEYDNRPSV